MNQNSNLIVHNDKINVLYMTTSPQHTCMYYVHAIHATQYTKSLQNS